MLSCPCQIGQCILCEAHLFSGLGAEQVCQIQGMVSKRSYRPHEILFREKDPDAYLFLLREGQVKLTTSLPDGRQQILGLRVAGHLLGFATLDDRAYPYTAEALTAVQLCIIRHRSMLRVLRQNPEVSLRLIRMLNDELERSQALIRDLGLKTASEKVASFVLSLVPPRAPYPTSVSLVLSRQEIAGMLGLTVETVSRTIAEFKRTGVIQTPHKQILILDMARLRTLAGSSTKPDEDNKQVIPIN